VGSKDKPWTPSPGDTNPSLTVYLPDVNGVPAGVYPIMKVDLTPIGDAGTITVVILDKDNNPVFEGKFTNTPITISPAVAGTTIVISFTNPTPIYDLKVVACVPPVTEVPVTTGVTPELPTTTIVIIETTPVVVTEVTEVTVVTKVTQPPTETEAPSTTPYPCTLQEVVVSTGVTNISPSSGDVRKLIPGGGDKFNPWTPGANDDRPKITIKLPEVNGVPAGEYPIMQVDLTPVGDLGTVIVKIFDKNGNVVFEGSFTDTPIDIRPVVSGTVIEITFLTPVPVYDLKVVACIPPVTIVPTTTVPEKTTSAIVFHQHYHQ
jgi:hypothetical protein